MQYEYSYSTAGRVTTQRLQASGLPNMSAPVVLDAAYAWDNEGRLTSRTYPSYGAMGGTAYSLQYDIMGRLNSITHQYCGNWYNDQCSDMQTITDASAVYGPANEMTSLTYGGYSETRAYNNLLQLTRQTVSGKFDMEYVFPAGANNGQISSTVDHITGEQVNYTYDSLKRLATAATVSTAWGQAYSYDGFGNLTAKTVTQGSATNLSQAYDPATNHAIGGSYDANGNTYGVYNGTNSIGYDAENRMSPTCTGCGLLNYDPAGKRLAVVNPTAATWTLYFYDIFGHRITTLTDAGQTTYSLYFGSKLVVSDGVTVITDRLGSVRANSNNETFSYFPYGEERTPTPDYRVKFGTYYRDGGWDYADQRYYNPWYGRFNTPDPLGSKAADPKGPSSWNMYAYTGGDPVNRNDPTGTFDDDSLEAPPDFFGPGGGGGGGGCDPFWDAFCGDPCGNSFLPNPACGYQGPAPSPDPGPTPPPPPECFAQLKDRPVNDPTAAKFNAVHTFWWVQDDTGTQYIISGGPTKANSSGVQYLNVSVTPGNNNGSGDSSSAHMDWSSGLSSIVCDQVDVMAAAAKDWQSNHNNTIVYHPVGVLGIGGPNSNSAAHYFGVISGFNPNPPTTAYGWWSPIVFP